MEGNIEVSEEVRLTTYMNEMTINERRVENKKGHRGHQHRGGTTECNIRSCRTCNEEWRPKEKRNEWREKNSEPTEKWKTWRPKYCFLKCLHCTNTIWKLEEERAFDWAFEKKKEKIEEEEDNEPEKVEKRNYVKESLDKGNVVQLEESIMRLGKDDLFKIEVRGDGNCLSRSILKSSNLDIHLHDDLRLSIAGRTRRDGNNAENEAVAEEMKKRAEKLESWGTYMDNREVQTVAKSANIWIAVLNQTSGHRGSKWTIYKGENQSIASEIMFFTMKYNSNPDQPQGTHYEALMLEELGPENGNRLQQKVLNMMGKTTVERSITVNVLLSNIRS